MESCSIKFVILEFLLVFKMYVWYVEDGELHCELMLANRFGELHCELLLANGFGEIGLRRFCERLKLFFVL